MDDRNPVRGIGWATLMLAAVGLVGCKDAAEVDFERCTALASAKDLEGATRACEDAVRADSSSTAGTAAGKMLVDLKRLSEAEAARAARSAAGPQPAPAPEKELPTVQAEVRKVLAAWNLAHQSGHHDEFESVFASKVFFYGMKLSGDDCAAKKRELLKKTPNFQQKIEDDVKVTERDGRVRVEFTKTVTTDTEKQYPSYLELAKIDGAWKVAVEGDTITDKNLAKMIRKGAAPGGGLTGDFNGDGKSETVKVIDPEVTEMHGCKGDCSCRLEFSDPGIQPLIVENSIGVSLYNEGDLDGDGSDDLGVYPSWFTSCWHDFRIFSMKTGLGRQIASVATHCAQWQDGVHPVKKHPSEAGQVLVTSTELGDEGFYYQTKTIRLGESD